MEKNQIIIVALIVVIAALLIGMAAMMMPNMTKQDTKIKFKSEAKLNEGDTIKFKLTDEKGNAISGKTVNITITDKNDVKSHYSAKTNENGIGSLKLDKSAGKYDVTVKFGGSKEYNACYETQQLTIEEEVAETQSSSSYSTPSAYAYKSDGTPMYSQAEVDQYMYNKYGSVNYHIGSNRYIDMDQPGYDDAGHWIGYR